MHNTNQLGCGRALEKFPEIITRLTGMGDRFTSMLDCLEFGLPARGHPRPAPTARPDRGHRIGGVDVNKPRIRTVLAAVLALAVGPEGFAVAQFTTKVRSMSWS